MRRVISTAVVLATFSILGCGSSATRPLSDADLQAQKAAEEEVRQAEKNHVKNQPKPKTQEESVEEAERKRPR